MSEKHDCGEDGEKQTLEDKEEKKDDCSWRGEGGTLPPLTFDADDELVDAEEQAMQTQQGNVELTIIHVNINTITNHYEGNTFFYQCLMQKQLS